MAAKNASRPQILVVEDDSAVRRSLQLLLAARGYAVRAHASAASALADPNAWQSDCLVADLIMADIDGVALLDLLRHKGWEGAAILISGHLNDEHSRRAADAGYGTIMQKPLADGLLLEAVAKAVESDC